MGRVALVTGAGRGVGRQHALLLAAQGAKVLVNDPGVGLDGLGGDAGPAHAVVEEIRAAGGQAEASTEPVGDWDACRRVVQAALDAFGDLHVVVNNAGILRDRMLVNMSEDEYDAVVHVHLKGTFGITRHAAQYWRDASRLDPPADRSVINTSSCAGLEGNPGQTSYAAAKAGIAAMTQVHARELARYGVRVNCIAPLARTRGTLQVPGLGEAVQTEGAAFDVFDPANVSPLVTALARADSPFTGQVFSVLGGHVGLYQPWHIAAEITGDGRWEPDALADAMREGLPLSVPARGQTDVLASAALDTRDLVEGLT